MWRHRNALFCQKFTNWQCCVWGHIVVMKLEESSPLQFPFKLASPFFSDGPGFQDNIFDSLWNQLIQILHDYLPRIEKSDENFHEFWFAHASFLLSWRLWRVQFLILPLGFRVIFEKATFVTYYNPFKVIWFSFEPFKHFCLDFISTCFLIIIQIFWNHLCT
jgi:hypothetical protein